MKKCPKCSTDNPDDAEFCSLCMAKFDTSKASNTKKRQKGEGIRLQEGESVVHELRPEPELATLLVLRRGLLWIPIAIFLGIPVTSLTSLTILVKASTWPIIVFITTITLLVLAALVAGSVYSVHLRRTYVYYITNRRCIFRGGILRKVERSIPYHKITDVEISQDILERAFGISSVKIFTPGTASVSTSVLSSGQRAEITFAGLADSETPSATISEPPRSRAARHQKSKPSCS